MGCIQSKRHHDYDDDVYELGINFVRPRITNYHKKREQEKDLPMMIIVEVDGPTHWDRTPLHHHHDDDDDDYIEFPESSRKSDPIDPDYDPITDMLGITSLDVINRRSYQNVGTVIIDKVVDYSIDVDESELSSTVSSEEGVVDSKDATNDIGDDLDHDSKRGSGVTNAGAGERGAEEKLVSENLEITKDTAAPRLEKVEPYGTAFQPIPQQKLTEAGDAGQAVPMTPKEVSVYEKEEEDVASLLRDMVEKAIAVTIRDTEKQMVERFLEVIIKAVQVAADERGW